MGSNQERQKRARFSVKPHVESRAVAGRGMWAVQLPEGVKFYKFAKEGSVRLDILPFRASALKLHPHSMDGTWYEKTYYIHRNVGISNTIVICPQATFGKPCPICEYRSTLDMSDEEDAKQNVSLRPQQRQLFNVIAYEDGKQSDVMVLDQPRSGLGKQVDDMIQNADDEDNYQYYVDLNEGSTLKIGVTQQNAGTFKYLGVSTVEFKPRAKPYDESILDKTVDLDSVLNLMSYEDLKDMFHGTGEYDPAKKDEEEPPKSAKKASKAAKSDDDDDDDDEPLAKPAKSKSKATDEDELPVKAKSKQKQLVDDEEDEDDDDVPPVKSKAKVPIDDNDDDAPPVKSKAKVPVDEDDDEDEPPMKTKASAKPAETKKRVPVEDWEDDEDDD